MKEQGRGRMAFAQLSPPRRSDEEKEKEKDGHEIIPVGKSMDPRRWIAVFEYLGTGQRDLTVVVSLSALERT